MKYHRTTTTWTKAATTTALLAGLLLVSACGTRSVAPTPIPLPASFLTESAGRTYDFLLYQDLRLQLQHLIMDNQSDAASPEFLKKRSQLLSQAEEMLDRVLAASPSPELFAEKAGLHWSDADHGAQARQALKNGLKAFPTDRTLHLYLAESYLVDGQTQAAIDTIHDYLVIQPDDQAAREKLGVLLSDTQEWALALDELNRIPKDKLSADALFTMARAQGKLGMNQKAMANLEKALKIDPEFIEALAELAYQQELARDFVAAFNTYEVILSKSGERPDVQARMVNLQLKLNNPDKALELALDGPRTKSFLLDTALIFINDGFFAQASTVLDVMNEEGELPPEYYFYKAHIANEGENDPTKAIEYLDSIDQQDRLYPQALRFKIQLTNVLGEEKKALEMAGDGIKRFPNLPVFYSLKAALLTEQKRFGEAKIILESGLKQIPEDPELMYELGMLLEEMGDRDGALEIVERLIKQEPDNAKSLNFLGYTLAEDNRDLDRALVLVNEAARLEPDSGYITDSVAWVHFKRGELDKAWEQIRLAVELTDKEPVLWEHYGDIAAAAGFKDEARKGYRKALKLKPANPDAVRAKLNAL